LPQENFMVLALAELIAAWNWLLQSEKSIVAAAGWPEDELEEAEEEAELVAADADVPAGGLACSVEVQAAVTSSATLASRTDRRVDGRVAGTRRGYPRVASHHAHPSCSTAAPLCSRLAHARAGGPWTAGPTMLP
jgi:hypothetical protein